MLTRGTFRRSCVLALLVLAACSSDDTDAGDMPGDAGPDLVRDADGSTDHCPLSCEPDETLLDDCSCALIGARMRLTPPGARSGFYDLPWPHELRRVDDGSLDLSDFPFPDGVTLLEDNVPLLASVTFGFGTNASIYLGFDSPLDPASLPEDAAASREDDASVFLMNVDPESDGYGERVPMSFRYVEVASDYIDAEVLVALPFPGFPLRPDTLYGLFVTDRLLATDGESVQPSGTWKAVRAGSDAADSPQLAELARSYEPLFAAAEAHEVDAETIVGGTVFRTQDPTAQLRALAGHARSLPAPALESIALESRAPENPAEDGNFTLLTGHFEAPIYQQGEPPYAGEGGDIRFDAAGDPMLAGMGLLRFALTLPDGDMPAGGWPVALYHHGSGGDAFSFHRDGTAFHVAEAGVAMIGIDAPLHGERNPSTGDPTLLFFNIDNLLALRDNLRQGAVDLLVLERFVRALDVGSGDSPTGAAIRFDPDRIFAMGHSQGSLTLPIMLALTDGISGAMLSGAGGSVAATIATKLEPFSIPALARGILQLSADEELDMFHPALALVSVFGEPSDPLNFVPYYYRWGNQGLHLWLTSGLDDGWVPPEVTNALATAAMVDVLAPEASPVEGLELRGRGAVEGPVSGNLEAADGESYTAVLSQYPGQGHFLIQNLPGAEAQLTRWFETLVQGTPELISTP